MKEITFRKPRRKDRAVEDAAWIRDLLARAPVGTLASLTDDGTPAIAPNLFVLDPSRDAIYLHTAKRGETRSNVEQRSRVAFSAVEMGRLLPASAAVDFSVEYASVVVEGSSVVVEDPEEARRALDLLMRKYAPHLKPEEHYRGIDPKDLARTAVYRIDIESWSGKAKSSTAADAYDYASVAAHSDPARQARTGFFTALQAGFHSAFWATPPERRNGGRHGA